jgi:nitroreductase
MQPHILEMNVFEAILARRSVRSYSEQEVDSVIIRTLLEAAVRAPTALHQQPQAFVVIQNRSLLKRLSDVARPLFVEEARRISHALDAFANPDFNIFYDAGTLIVIGSISESPFVAADCWLAAENLMLAACAMGLGTCVIGSALPALNAPEVKAKFGFPANFLTVAPIIVGHPSGETASTPRKQPLVLALESNLDDS